VAGGQSLIVGGLGVELGTQPGLALSAAQAPFGALGAAGGPGQREHALRGRCASACASRSRCRSWPSWVSWYMAVISFPAVAGLSLCSTVAAGQGGHHT
jgi:hypothetical protein